MINENEMQFKIRKLENIYVIPPQWGISIPFEFESEEKFSAKEFEVSLKKDTLRLLVHRGIPNEYIKLELKEKNSALRLNNDIDWK